MASTYSNLKIQLMATGENSTTWGDVTNVNLGTALEEAIAGSADVTFASGNVTLTLTDSNSTQTARNMRLRCTGTTGGSTRNLVVPSIEKPYIVKNDCADSILVKTAAGSGITVPAGKTIWVYSDGTDVVDATTHLTSLTLGTALAVAQGGTGANTATDARTNLGLGTMAVQAASGVAITGGSVTGITDLTVADGGTGASDAAAARTNLGAAASGANTDIVSLSPTGGLQVGAPTGGAKGAGTLNATGLYVNGAAVGPGTVTSVNASGGTTGMSFSGGPVTSTGTLTLAGTLGVTNGGTGSTTAADARTALGLGTMAVQAANNVVITGGSVVGITDVAIADGGTGASTAAAAFANIAVAASDLTSTGYIKLQNGLILQWGTKSVSTDSSAAVLFATSGINFPTACWNVQLSWIDTTVGSGSAMGSSGISGLTTTGFTIYNDSNTRTHYWFAIGN